MRSTQRDLAPVPGTAFLLAVCVFLSVCAVAPRLALAGFPCPVCGEEYKSRGDLKEHIVTAHNGEVTPSTRGGYVCERCGKFFQSKVHGKKHEEECRASRKTRITDKSQIPEQLKVNYRSYQCKACGKHFMTLSRGIEHVEGKCTAPYDPGKKDNKTDDKTKVPDGLELNWRGWCRCKACGKRFYSIARGKEHVAEKCTARVEKPDARKRPPPRSEGATSTVRDGAKPVTTQPVRAGSIVKRPLARRGDVTVVLKSGSRFVGRIESRSKSSITLKTPQGAEVSFNMEQVKEVIDPRSSTRDNPE